MHNISYKERTHNYYKHAEKRLGINEVNLTSHNLGRERGIYQILVYLHSSNIRSIKITFILVITTSSLHDIGIVEDPGISVAQAI